MKGSMYTKKSLEHLKQKLLKLILVDEQGIEKTLTTEQVEKMIALCKKRNNPSYYKLRHASGMGEEFSFKNINIYSNDGTKMRRFKSELEVLPKAL